MPPGLPPPKERRDGMADSPTSGQNVPKARGGVVEPSGLYLFSVFFSGARRALRNPVHRLLYHIHS